MVVVFENFLDNVAPVVQAGNLVLSAQFVVVAQPVVEYARLGRNDFEAFEGDTLETFGLVIGVYLLKKFEGFSVGRVSLVINIFIYGICAILFNLQTAIYSIIYSAVYMLAVDKTHFQNINVTCIIISKEKEVREMIMSKLSRGVTCWKGFGAYTGSDTDVMVTVVNKYEEPVVKQIVKETDPGAFVIFFEGTYVSGHFEKRI